MIDNVSIKGRFVFAAGLSVKNEEIRAFALSDKDLNKLADKFSDIISDISERAHKLKGKSAHSLCRLSENKLAVFYIKEDKINFYVYNTKSNEATRYVSIKELSDIINLSGRITSHAENSINHPEKDSTMLSSAVQEITSSIEEYIDNPQRAGPAIFQKVKIDDDFNR